MGGLSRGRRSACLGSLRRLLDNVNRQRVAQLHYVIYQDFDVVRASFIKNYLPPKYDAGGVRCGVGQLKFDFALSQHRRLIGRDEANALHKVPKSGCPTVEHADFLSGDRQLRHADEIEHADEQKVAIDFLADFLAQERALQVG